MKKILLTTTALTLIAGAAAAGISLSGSARFIAQSIGGTTSMGNRTRINFKASGQTDSGIDFGFSQRIQANDGAAAGLQTPTIWVSNGVAKLKLGNTDGAIGTTTGFYSVGGCGFGTSGNFRQYCANTLVTTQGNIGYSGSSSGGGATTSAVVVAFSLGSANVSVSGGNSAGGVANDTEIAANFTVGGWTLGVGHDTGSTSGISGNVVTAVGALGGAKVAFNYGKYGITKASWVARVSQPVNGGSINGFIGSMSGVNTAGIEYNMDLGGGAVFNVGASKVFPTAAATTSNVISAGMKFSF